VSRARRQRRRAAAERPEGEAPARTAPAADEAVAQPVPITARWKVVLAVIVALAAVVRFACARGDLWLDEVWTLAMLSSIDSPLQIVTKLTHDNNHILNSFFAWWLRGGADIAVRIPAVVAGTAGVAVAAWFAGMDDDSRDPSAPAIRAALAGLLQATSYLMVHYQSEARGYALALGIGLLSPWAFLRARGAAASRLAIVHWVAAGFALLGHAVAVHLFLATAAWSFVRFRRDGLAGPSLVRALIWWHGVPAATTALVHQGFLSRMVIGGGPEESLVDVLGRVMAYTFGVPLALGTFGLLLLGVLIVGGGLWVLRRIDSDQWAFYATGLLLSPMAALLVQPGDLRFERYFYVSAALGLLLLGRMLALLASRSAIAAAAAVVLFVGAQLPRIQRLAAEGRGHYRGALSEMAARTPTRPVRVGGDHDFRNGLVISYYTPRLGLDGQLVYVPAQAVAASGADWYIVHRPGNDPDPPAGFTDAGGRTYRLEWGFPSAPLSGFRWFLFRREGAPQG
jgi:hypothetical protein